MSGCDCKCNCQGEKINEENKKGEKREASPLHPSLKTTTETSNFFFLSKFNAKDVSYEERLPKNFKDFENLLNKILISLEETENVFFNQAKAVLDRDLVLIKWRLRLKSLQNILKEKQQDFERIDQTVQCFLKLSSHIDNILVKLERELPGATLVCNAFKYTPERMSMYDAMLKINASQRDMLQQISSAILTINEVIDCNPCDPVEQYTRILGLHMEVLRTIERRACTAEDQISVVQALQKFYTNTRDPILYDYYR